MNKKLIIEIDNLTSAQELAIKELMYNWKYSGIVGSSYWTAFFADGDGNFRPNIKINNEDVISNDLARNCGMIKQPINLSNRDFAIDFDCLAWKLDEIEENKEIEEMQKVDYPLVSET